METPPAATVSPHACGECNAERQCAALPGRQVVDLGGQDEIALGEAVDFMSPDLEVDPPPSQPDIRMVTLFFRQFTDLVGEIESTPEILELEAPLQMVCVHDPPSGIDLVKQFIHAISFQRRCASLAGNALFG